MPTAQGQEVAPRKSGRSTTNEPNPLEKGALSVAEGGDAFASLFEEREEAAERRPGEPEPDDGNAAVEGDDAEVETETTEEPEESEEGAEEGEAEAEPKLEADEGQTYPITIDGEVKQVPLAELASSYLRQADYTRKTQALSDERRAFEERRSAWAEETQALGERFDEIIPVIVAQYRQTQKSSQELERMRVEDPGSWSAYMHERKVQLDQLRSAREQRQAITAQQEAERRRELEASIPTQMNSLMAKNARYKGKNGAFNTAHYEAVGKFLLSQGITAEEWAELYDHRMLHLADLAMQAVAATRSVKRAAPSLAKLARPVRPGSLPERKVTPRETAVTTLRAKEKRLERTGSVRDAGDLFSELFQ